MNNDKDNQSIISKILQSNWFLFVGILSVILSIKYVTTDGFHSNKAQGALKADAKQAAHDSVSPNAGADTIYVLNSAKGAHHNNMAEHMARQFAKQK